MENIKSILFNLNSENETHQDVPYNNDNGFQKKPYYHIEDINL